MKLRLLLNTREALTAAGRHEKLQHSYNTFSSWYKVRRTGYNLSSPLQYVIQ
jgi:hypothetical protein